MTSKRLPGPTITLLAWALLLWVMLASGCGPAPVRGASAAPESDLADGGLAAREKPAESLPPWTARDRLCAAASQIVVADIYPSVPEAGVVTLRCLVLATLKGKDADSIHVRHRLERAPPADARPSPIAKPAYPGVDDVEAVAGRTMIAFVRTGANGQLELVDRGHRRPTRRALVADSPTEREAIRLVLANHQAALKRPLPTTEVDDVVTALVDGMTTSGWTHDIAITQLSRLPRSSIPAIVGRLDDHRELPVRRVQLTDSAADRTVYPTRQVRDSLAVVLAHVAREDFGIGLTDAQRTQSNNAWKIRVRYAR